MLFLVQLLGFVFVFNVLWKGFIDFMCKRLICIGVREDQGGRVLILIQWLNLIIFYEIDNFIKHVVFLIFFLFFGGNKFWHAIVGGALMNIVCAPSLREVLENYCWEFEFDGMVMGTEWWVLWKTSSKFNYLAQNRIDKFPMLVLELLDFTHIFCKFLISQCFILFLFRLITFSKIFFFLFWKV